MTQNSQKDRGVICINLILRTRYYGDFNLKEFQHFRGEAIIFSL